jgi:hypothetical protein
MSLTKLTILTLLIITAHSGYAQDTVLAKLEQIPKKYITQIDAKADKYYNRITTKTEKTLEKLSKWENKIKALLEKANPETAQRLFGNNQLSFATVLEKYKQGKAISDDYRKQYDGYRDKLNSSIAYLDKQKAVLDTKLVKPVKEAKEKLKKLGEQEDNTEAVQQFIKERKKQLIEQSIQYIGKSKYLTKINKEAYFYAETLRNYKEIFQDKKKAEETALTILNKIPAFQKFTRENSQMASRFALSGNSPAITGIGMPSFSSVPITYNGLQSRVSVQQAIQQRVGTANGTSVENLQNRFRDAMKTYGEFKNKLELTPKSINEASGLKHVNSQRTKTFRQRLDFRFNFQFEKPSNFFPSSCKTGLLVGYKINDKSIAGAGFSYVLGMGNGWQHIRLSNEGIGGRTFIEYKTGKSFYLHAAAEWNYMNRFGKLNELYKTDKWQKSALAGLSKKINLKGKMNGSVEFLYDFLYRSHFPVSNPFVYRIGYSF